MPSSREYVERAEQCYRLASEAKTETDRLACLDLARVWLEAAARQSEMTPEQIAEAEKLEHAWQPKPETPQPQTRAGWRQRIFGFFRPRQNTQL